MDTYAVAIISASDTDGNMKLTTKNLSIQQIVKEVIPGMHPRDFFSLALTSLGDAERKRRILMKTHYSVKNSINPWFILPRETEIIVSDTIQQSVCNDHHDADCAMFISSYHCFISPLGLLPRCHLVACVQLLGENQRSSLMHTSPPSR